MLSPPFIFGMSYRPTPRRMTKTINSNFSLNRLTTFYIFRIASVRKRPCGSHPPTHWGFKHWILKSCPSTKALPLFRICSQKHKISMGQSSFVYELTATPCFSRLANDTWIISGGFWFSTSEKLFALTFPFIQSVKKLSVPKGSAVFWFRFQISDGLESSNNS